MATILGTAFADTLSGSIGNDTIASSTGADFISASLGSDLINAGYRWSSSYWKMNWSDYDVVDYGAVGNVARIVADLQAGTVVKYAANGTVLGTDTLIGVDAVRGTAGNDVFRGRDFGWDYEEFRGGAGNDTIDGRGGFDGAHYGNATAAITVNLAAGTVTGDASVGGDTLRQVEQIVGTRFADTFVATGFSGASTNRSSSGDTFNQYAPGAGDDTITGNGDTALNYSAAGGALSLSLAALTSPTARADILLSYVDDANNPGGVDPGLTPSVAGVNGLRGGAYNDTLVGGGRVNSDGFGSTVSGDGSFERLRGAGGDDFINGGTGLDRAEYNVGNPQSEGITVLLARGIVTGDAIQVGTDTLRGIESVTSTYLNDVYDATGFTLRNAAVASVNSGDCIVSAPTGETLASQAFNEFRPLGGSDLVTGNGATRISFTSMGVEQATSAAVPASIVATFTGASTGSAAYGLTDGGLGSVRFTGTYGIVGSTGNDSLTGSAGFQELRGYYGNDTLSGGDGNDRLFGFNGSTSTNTGASSAVNTSNYSDNDVLDGGAGNDLLRGDFGNDTLVGGIGDDSLSGGTGQDLLTGGGGADRFVFATPAEFNGSAAAAALDTVTDFLRGTDRIDLSAIDANTTAAAAGDQAFASVIVGNGAFTANAQLRLDAATGILYGNTDGNGATAEFALRLTGISTLALSDFVA